MLRTVTPSGKRERTSQWTTSLQSDCLGTQLSFMQWLAALSAQQKITSTSPKISTHSSSCNECTDFRCSTTSAPSHSIQPHRPHKEGCHLTPKQPTLSECACWLSIALDSFHESQIFSVNISPHCQTGCPSLHASKIHMTATTTQT